MVEQIPDLLLEFLLKGGSGYVVCEGLEVELGRGVFLEAS